MRRFMTGFHAVIGTLLVLVPLELVLQYDALERQIALTLTNVAAIAFLLVLRRWLARQGEGLQVSAALLIASAVWLDALGNFAHYYGRFAWWDQLTHAVGTASVTYAAFVALAALIRAGRMQLSGKALGLFAVCVGTTVAAIYEITEYIGDLLFGTNRVTDRYDSPDDLLWNLLASVAIVLIARWTARRR